MERFPFGQPVMPVTWHRTGASPVLVVGVYPSAAHARWIGVDGRTRIRAVAVANEPEPFWAGDDAEAQLATAAADLPAAVGRLQPAVGHNGRSGRALDAWVLAPLGLARDQIRAVDIVNRYMANRGQQAAITREYLPLVKKGSLPPVTWQPRRPVNHIPDDRRPALIDELDEADPDWVITLGNEPLKALGLDPLSKVRYGRAVPATILGRRVRLLALVHTRQQAGHGASSSEWALVHRRWRTGSGAATVRDAMNSSLEHRPAHAAGTAASPPPSSGNRSGA